MNDIKKELSISAQCDALAIEIVNELCHFEDQIDAQRAANKISEQITALAKAAYAKGVKSHYST